MLQLSPTSLRQNPFNCPFDTLKYNIYWGKKQKKQKKPACCAVYLFNHEAAADNILTKALWVSGKTLVDIASPVCCHWVQQLRSRRFGLMWQMVPRVLVAIQLKHHQIQVNEKRRSVLVQRFPVSLRFKMEMTWNVIKRCRKGFKDRFQGDHTMTNDCYTKSCCLLDMLSVLLVFQLWKYVLGSFKLPRSEKNELAELWQSKMLPMSPLSLKCGVSSQCGSNNIALCFRLLPTQRRT